MSTLQAHRADEQVVASDSSPSSSVVHGAVAHGSRTRRPSRPAAAATGRGCAGAARAGADARPARRERQLRAALVASAAPDDGLRRAAIGGEYPEGVLSGDWPDEDFSVLSDVDLLAYLESRIVTSDQMSPGARLLDVMSRPVQVATPGQRLAEVDAFFAAHQYSGLPVLDEEEGRCVGVVSEKDKAKATNGMESTVGEVMSSPAITLTPEKIVLEAAALMLKEKVHRIPVVNEQNIVIGKVLQIVEFFWTTTMKPISE
ncbi:hypothetical protein U9M48_030842 [Paspalum notatum var. saurae]|uniref:CBS domain-containing protein n=1 Tax=Paspalum notatum var. saurae TaxID=547442 RepID=A0AAQ3U4F8_PASNO